MPNDHAGDPVIREATTAELDKLVAYEIEIARISFPANPVIDPDAHRARLARALLNPREGTFVATSRRDPRAVRGWAWVSMRDNFLTGETYANLRSIAVDDVPDATPVAQALVERAAEFARGFGVNDMVGRVHVRNIPMRAIYRSLGFEAEHLTLRKTW